MTDATDALSLAVARLKKGTKVNTGALQALSSLAILLYGTKKSGKSTFCSRIPGAYFLDITGTLRSVKSNSIPLPTWAAIRAATKLLGEPGVLEDMGIQVVIVDEINEAWEKCRRDVLAARGYDHEQDGEFGRGSDAVKKEFGDWFNDLRNLPCGFILLAQSNEVELVKKKGARHKTMPNIAKNAWNIVGPPLDMVWYCTKVTKPDGSTEHTLFTKGSSDLEGGDATGRLPNPMALDYDEVAKAYAALGQGGSE